MAEENHMNQGPAVSPQRKVMEEQSGTSKRTGSLTRAAGASGQVWDEASESVRTLKENTDQYIRKNPAKAVFTALAIGFVFGLIRRR